MQVQKEDSEKQKIIDIPSPELLDFKVRAAELKTSTKVRNYVREAGFHEYCRLNNTMWYLFA